MIRQPLILVIATLALATLLGPLSATAQTQAQRDVAAIITHGKIAYVAGNTVSVITIGSTSWTPQTIVNSPNTIVRWDSTGKYLAAATTSDIFLIDVAARTRTKLNKAALFLARNDAFDFFYNGTEIAYAQADGIWAIKVSDQSVRKLAENPNAIQGELGISRDGTRLAGRGCCVDAGGDLFAVDLTSNQQYKYARNCSSGISPDGTRLMKNGGPATDVHTEFTIFNWINPATVFKTLKTADGADSDWDNQHWSNDADFIATETLAGVGIIQVSSGKSWVVGPKGGIYPDLWVDHSGSGVRTIERSTNSRRRTSGLVAVALHGDSRQIDGHGTVFSLRGRVMGAGAYHAGGQVMLSTAIRSPR